MLVPSTCTLRELHGVIQVAMGWEGIHLCQFCLRAARCGLWKLLASSPEVMPAALRLRKGARFIYEHDLNIPWRHEVRTENQLEPAAGKAYPICTGDGGACPPKNCDGLAASMASCNGTLSLGALEDLATMTEIIGQSSWSAGRTCWTTRTQAGGWRAPSSAARRVSTRKGKRSSAQRSTPGSAKASAAASCTSSADALRPAPGQQVGSGQRGIVAALLPNTGSQGLRGWIDESIEPALERGSGCLGVVPGRGDALVAEEALQVGDVHARREQAGSHRVPEQVGVDALGDPSSIGHGPDDLAHALAGQGVRHRIRSLLPAGEQRPSRRAPMWSWSNWARSRRIGISRRSSPLPCLMVTTRSARLTSSILTGDNGAVGMTEEVAAFEKQVERPGDVGLSLAEGKALTAAVQGPIVKAQVTFRVRRKPDHPTRACLAGGRTSRSRTGRRAALLHRRLPS